jgi:hypothetical protein
VAKATRIEELPEIYLQNDILKTGEERLAHLGNEVRARIDCAAGLNDAVTADILTRLSASLDKELWFVEAWSHSDNDRNQDFHPDRAGWLRLGLFEPGFSKGMRIRKMVPTPDWLSTVMVPPMSDTKLRTIAKPKPALDPSVLRAGSRR